LDCQENTDKGIYLMFSTRSVKEAIGSIIKLRRQGKKMTQGEVAARYGIAQRYISCAENGDWDSLTTLSKLLNAMDISAEWLFERLTSRFSGHDIDEIKGEQTHENKAMDEAN